MPEYRKFRCCMCPNINEIDEQKTMCPTGPLKTEITACRFVKTYVDERGWRYKVMGGLGESNYKARYKKPDASKYSSWKCLKQMPWRKSFDEAQSDLNIYAAKKGWQEV